MRLSLSKRQRVFVLFFSASAYTAWFAGLGERSEAQSILSQPMPVVTIREAAPPPRVATVIRRDPFAGRPTTGGGNAHPTTDGSMTDGALRGQTTSVGTNVDVPNITGRMPGASIAEAPLTETTLVLRATIVGPSPVAYVEDGRSMDIVRVGDTLGERRIAKIDLRGITFRDGTRLDLPDGYLATPEPQHRRTVPGTPVTLEALKALLLQRPSAAPSSSPEVRPAQPSPSSGYPSPAPLATANSQGLPVGVNPTPDVNAPTPYPYPYPYAPPVRH